LKRMQVVVGLRSHATRSSFVVSAVSEGDKVYFNILSKQAVMWPNFNLRMLTSVVKDLN